MVSVDLSTLCRSAFLLLRDHETRHASKGALKESAVPSSDCVQAVSTVQV